MFGSKEQMCSARGNLIDVRGVQKNADVGALPFLAHLLESHHSMP